MLAPLQRGRLHIGAARRGNTQVLEDLIEEHDSAPDVWHLLSLAYYSGGQLEEAGEVLERGRQLLARLGVPPGDEIHDSYEDLAAAIAEARAGGGKGGGA
jgi:DNA-binding SARP family transcriptional activator